MTKREFVQELTRLHGGTRLLDALTKERVEGWWAAFGTMERGAWRIAVARVAGGGMLPLADDMERIAQAAEAEWAAHKARRANREATLGEMVASAGERGGPLARLCAAATKAVLDQGLSPAETADCITVMAGGEELEGWDLRAWLLALRTAGDRWEGMDVRACRIVRVARVVTGEG